MCTFIFATKIDIPTKRTKTKSIFLHLLTHIFIKTTILPLPN